MCVYLIPTSDYLDYCNRIENHGVRFQPGSLSVWFSRSLAYLYKLRITCQFPFPFKKTFLNIDWNCTKLISQFGENQYLSNV